MAADPKNPGAANAPGANASSVPPAAGGPAVANAEAPPATGPAASGAASPGVAPPGAAAASGAGNGADVDEADETVSLSFSRQLRMITRAVRGSPVKKKITTLIISIVVIVLATAYGQIRLNQWNKPFYDALSRRDLRDFLYQLGVFAIIAGVLLVLNVVQRWLVETFKYKLREGLVRDLLGHWMLPRRAFWLANAGPMGVNPDQRMHEDARKLCDLSADLGVGLFQASILFATFAGVLWTLSNDFSFRISGTDYAVPGFMLWAAVAYAGIGSLLSSVVGRSLINRNEVRYAREADFRFSLVRINEHLDDISLASGEADEKRRVELHLTNILAATRRLVSALTNLTWVTAGFGWITTVAPILAAAPLYFAGKISFGGLMMAAAAFTQAQSSLRWFVDNFSTIADWRATLLRVASFRFALTSTEDQEHDQHRRITYNDGAPGVMSIDEFEVESPSGCDMLKERTVTVNAGERVLIVGAPGTSKTLLFRALAGLWPWGAGSITRPKDEPIFFLPRGTPYLPRGTLREVLAYPQKVDGFDQNAFASALTRLGLERLVPLLDQTQRWDRELSLDEQLGLAFARITLLSPRWLLMDDAFGSLEDEAVERVIDVFNNELKHTAIIHIGRAAQARDPIFARVLHLVKKTSKSDTAAMRALKLPASDRP
jgi:putative ATP-binding cassette transporter